MPTYVERIVREWQCDYCDRVFNDVEYVKRHERLDHSTENTPTKTDESAPAKNDGELTVVNVNEEGEPSKQESVASTVILVTPLTGTEEAAATIESLITRIEKAQAASAARAKAKLDKELNRLVLSWRKSINVASRTKAATATGVESPPRAIKTRPARNKTPERLYIEGLCEDEIAKSKTKQAPVIVKLSNTENELDKVPPLLVASTDGEYMTGLERRQS